MTTNKPEALPIWKAEDAWADEVMVIRLTDYEARMAVLFDGNAVYSALSDNAKQFISPHYLASVLDAVVKLMGEVSNDNQ